MAIRACICVALLVGALLALAALMVVLAPMSAMAQAAPIDGDWCSEDGRNMAVDGDQLFLDSGERITGEKTDRTFVYEAPEGDPNAGARTTLFAVDEERMRKITEGEHFSEDWMRCPPVS